MLFIRLEKVSENFRKVHDIKCSQTKRAIIREIII